MDKIKNLVNPGSKKDDDVMYGSGVSDDPVHSSTAGTHPSQGSTSNYNSTGKTDPLSSSAGPSTGIGHEGTPSIDPLSSTTNPAGGIQPGTATSLYGTHGLKEPYASRMPGSLDDDTASTASIRSGVPGQATHTVPITTSVNQSDTTNKSQLHEPSTAGTELVGSSGSNPITGNDLTGNQYPDRSIGSSGTGGQPSESSRLGRDAALGGAVDAGGVGAVAYNAPGNIQQDHNTPETGRSFPLGGNTNTTAQHAGLTPTGSSTNADPRVDSTMGVGRTAAPIHQVSTGQRSGATFGETAPTLASHGPESWVHKHGKHGHEFGGDPCSTGETRTEGPHFVSGPHTTDTANRLDPHVAANSGISRDRNSHDQTHHGHQPQEGFRPGDPTVTSLGTVESNRHHPSTDTGANTESGTGPSATQTGFSSTGSAPGTSGPHKSNILNKLDPRVDSDHSKQHKAAGITDTDPRTSITRPSEPATSHHRDGGAALGGASLTGAAAYGGGKDQYHHEPKYAAILPESADRHSSSSNHPSVGNAPSTVHDPALARSSGEPYPGRSAALGAGGGVLENPTRGRHDQPLQSSNIPGRTSTGPHATSHGPSDYDQAGTRLAGSSQQSAASKDHHYGRDVALGAGIGGVAYEAEKHHGRDHPATTSTPQDQLAGSGHQYEALHPNPDRPHQIGHELHIGDNVSTGGADHANERSLQDPVHHSRRAEETLAGGAAAGELAHHERFKKEKALQKEHAKEERALEKEHAKEIKQHDKALAKEEKALEKDQKTHEKERAKHLAAIEKDQKKHEHDKHEHDKHKKEQEHDGEKKKHGLLGFLHRDKPDKELKEDEAARKASQETKSRPGNENLPQDTGSSHYNDPLAGEHGSQSGVHDSPIGPGTTTHEAYGTQEGHNKLHKDPPAKVLEARGQVYQGHGNVS